MRPQDANWSPVSDAGITIIPGTDALPGYSLHHELELYVRAGIPEVLRTATLTPTIVTPSSIRPSPSSLIPAWRPCEEHSRYPQHHYRDQGRKGLRSGCDRKSPRHRPSPGETIAGNCPPSPVPPPRRRRIIPPPSHSPSTAPTGTRTIFDSLGIPHQRNTQVPIA